MWILASQLQRLSGKEKVIFTLHVICNSIMIFFICNILVNSAKFSGTTFNVNISHIWILELEVM